MCGIAGFWSPRLSAAEHLRGYSSNAATLWPVLMYDSWAEESGIASDVATMRSTTVAEQFGRER